MNPQQLRKTSMNPATRRIFSLLMAKSESAVRRAWMEQKGRIVEADI